MQYKTTAKALKQGYYKIISVEYCELQNLLYYKSPIAYSRGVYGWNFDVYDIEGVAIATGYRGMPSKNSNVSYEWIKKFETASRGKTVEEKNALIKEFIKYA